MNSVPKLASLLLGSLLLCSGLVKAEENAVAPLRGTIDSVNETSMQITDRKGEKISVQLTDKTRVNGVVKGKIEDIKTDSFIGTAAVPQSDGTLKALEVHVFAPSLRGSGEGFRPFESADGSMNTMTNGTVGKLVNTQSRTLTLKYGDKEKTVVVPDNVPVVTIYPSDRSLLKPGVHVIVSAQKDTQGNLIARGVSAGKDGTIPPM
ncbi:hypothetical protein [Edaphovirga cremea]|uniref:hypothetical protein n=1 Tax=Edaphovirga cremea TaxID=2267246 RepID=UPI00398A0EAC